VLLVDAFNDEREMYAEYLRATGFNVRPFDNVESALADAALNSPSVAILRLHPWHGHREVPALIGRIKRHAATRGARVVALGTAMSPDEREASLRAGSDRYVLIPCLPDQLVGTIGDVLASP